MIMETDFHDLADVMQQAHAHTIAALSPDAPTLDGVTWCAVHLAAVERAIYPAVHRRVPEARSRVRRQMAVDHQLQHALWCLDRRLTGNMASALTPVENLAARIRLLVQEHAAGEAALLAELCQFLDEDGQAVLVGDLAALVARAPTRPHPNTPHVRFTDPLTFALESWVDRIRDAMDNRTIPTPRPRRSALPVGKWGAYLTAQPYPVVRAPKEVAEDEHPGKRI
jgi:hypothetical protein